MKDICFNVSTYANAAKSITVDDLRSAIATLGSVLSVPQWNGDIYVDRYLPYERDGKMVHGYEDRATGRVYLSQAALGKLKETFNHGC